MKKIYIALIILAVIISGLIYVWFSGYYPVALVNGDPIWAWRVEQEYKSALFYYSKAIGNKKMPNEDQEALRIASLEDLIEQEIINQNFNNFTGGEGEKLVSEKIDVYLSDPKLKNAARALFNLEIKEFTNVILIPQAKKEIIADILSKENRDYEKWLNSQKKSVKITKF